MTEPLRYPFPEPPPEGEAITVAPGILWFRLPLPMALDHVNVFALDDGPGWTVIDTGFRSRRITELWERLLDGPMPGKPVTRVLVTHHHPDHVGMAGWFQARGAELMMTRTAWLYARMLLLDEQSRPAPEALLFLERAGLEPARLAARAEDRPFNFADCVHPMPPGFTRLEEGQSLHIGGRDWLVRLGSGHAPDHVTLWTDGLVIGGDQLLPGISANIGVHANEPGADPVGEWLESCTRLSAHAREDQLVLPGHKLPFTGLPLRMAQMIEGHEQALTRLLAALDSPKSAVECFPVLFRREIGAIEEGLALAESVAHLNHLLRKGAVQRALSSEGVWLWRKAET